MPWVRVDDGYADHPKMVAIGPLGQALWLAGLAYCNRNLTDGFIPWAAAQRLIGWSFMDRDRPTAIFIGSPNYVHEEGAVTSEYVIALLLEARIWEEVTGGYRVHDYTDYQPTKAAVLAERERVKNRVQRYRAGGNAGGNAASNGVGTPGPVPIPVPNIPNPVPDAQKLFDEGVERTQRRIAEQEARKARILAGERETA